MSCKDIVEVYSLCRTY